MSKEAVTISVVVPAHNEQAVIGRCLGALTNGAVLGELDVVVVSNGSHDNTAEVARTSGRSVRVLESSIASKIEAINLGESTTSAFPRFFVDADVVLSISALRRMAGRLRNGDVLAVAPRFRMNLDCANWFVRAFYAINDMLPSSREGIGGSGVYGLSEEGRRRFEQFPNITADDGFVRLQFAPHERATLEDCESIVFAPRTLSDLVRIKTRSQFGSLELRNRYPQLWKNKGTHNGKELKRLLLCPGLWLKLAVYAYVKLVARARAVQRMRSNSSAVWERDETSREMRRSVPARS